MTCGGDYDYDQYDGGVDAGRGEVSSMDCWCSCFSFVIVTWYAH